ncbi:hypothetical protein KVR01_003183 [Diaporthe batatas]|uniref:uncharacterized protein n=1 Tax=Diaporthe batatas TaxID=748121 RepID=UPI001D05BDE4|nr:uncharacterized protein KVR01_003183 [Diaporthe batatas]KAG8167494.1 hypothetical protein KVR01_003183 [Diaporthe batatas]
MDQQQTDTAYTDNIFWPKWQIQFDDGKVHPHRFSGVHLGPMPKQASKSSNEPNSSHRSFNPPLDMLFIDNYIFKYYERPKTKIIFDRDPNLPQILSEVQKVAINASSLSESKEKDDIWLKKLRLILQFFPKIRAITVLTAVVLDLASPAPITRPMCFMDIGNTSIGDRMRHGILAGGDLKMLPYDPETLRPSDFAMQEWDKLPVEWPAFGKRKVDGTAPELYMGTMVFFGKEWIDLNSAGTPGDTCTLGRRSGDPMAAVIWKEIDEARRVEADIKARPRIDLMRNNSVLSSKKKGSSLALLKKASTFSLRSQSSKGHLKG